MIFRFFSRFFSSSSHTSPEIESWIQKIFGFSPANPTLFKTALRHRSVTSSEGNGQEPESNERLEYLGDSILDAIISHYLFNSYPDLDEGELSSLRAKMVRRKNLNNLGKDLNLHELMEHRLEEPEFSGSVLGNALEALFGAIYLDQGFENSQTIIVRFFEKSLDIDSLKNEEANPKSRMIEWAQKYKKEISFEVLEEKETEKGKVYKVIALLDGENVSSGQGSSKKKAEQRSAEQFLKTRI